MSLNRRESERVNKGIPPARYGSLDQVGKVLVPDRTLSRPQMDKEEGTKQTCDDIKITNENHISNDINKPSCSYSHSNRLESLHNYVACSKQTSVNTKKSSRVKLLEAELQAEEKLAKIEEKLAKSRASLVKKRLKLERAKICESNSTRMSSTRSRSIVSNSKESTIDSFHKVNDWLTNNSMKNQASDIIQEGGRSNECENIPDRQKINHPQPTNENKIRDPTSLPADIIMDFTKTLSGLRLKNPGAIDVRTKSVEKGQSESFIEEAHETQDTISVKVNNTMSHRRRGQKELLETSESNFLLNVSLVGTQHANLLTDVNSEITDCDSNCFPVVDKNVEGIRAASEKGIVDIGGGISSGAFSTDTDNAKLELVNNVCDLDKMSEKTELVSIRVSDVSSTGSLVHLNNMTEYQLSGLLDHCRISAHFNSQIPNVSMVVSISSEIKPVDLNTTEAGPITASDDVQAGEWSQVIGEVDINELKMQFEDSRVMGYSLLKQINPIEDLSGSQLEEDDSFIRKLETNDKVKAEESVVPVKQYSGLHVPVNPFQTELTPTDRHIQGRQLTTPRKPKIPVADPPTTSTPGVGGDMFSSTKPADVSAQLLNITERQARHEAEVAKMMAKIKAAKSSLEAALAREAAQKASRRSQSKRLNDALARRIHNKERLESTKGTNANFVNRAGQHEKTMYKIIRQGENMKKHLQKIKGFLHIFRKKWIKEYLPCLTRRSKWLKKVDPPKIGALAIIVDDNGPTDNWPQGQISRVFMGKDGQVRSVEITTIKGIYQRPMTKIAIISEGGEEC